MEFKEAIKLALQSLWQNKLRTVLTLLGVMIGVASVIAVVTLVNGANTYVTTKFTRLWRGRVHHLAVAGDDHQRGRLREVIRSARTSSTTTTRTCATTAQRCVGMGAHAGDRGQGDARDQLGDRPAPFAATRGRCRRCRTWISRRAATLPQVDEEHASHGGDHRDGHSRQSFPGGRSAGARNCAWMASRTP